MTRKNYFELIQNMGFDADKEFEIISKLISEKRRPYPFSSILNKLFSSILQKEYGEFRFYVNSGDVEGLLLNNGLSKENLFILKDVLNKNLSFQDVFNNNFLIYLKYRKTQFSSYDEVKEYFENNMNGIERLFSYIEFILDLRSLLNDNIHVKFRESDFYDRLDQLSDDLSDNLILISDSFKEIEERINYSLDKTNHELIELDSGNRIIVEKNVYASEVSQIVSETNIQEAMKVLEYNHFTNKGNIERKREILISLASYLEPLKDELNISEELKEVMKVNNKKIIAVAKLFDMYNNLGLRHNNSEQYHLEMTEEELEQWYDDIYTSTLFVILSLDEARILSKLKTLRNG